MQRMNMILSSSQPILQTRHLKKQVYNGDEPLLILRDITFQIQLGAQVAILGVSGAGKSTLLGLLAGLDIPTQGQVWLAGQELTQLDEDGRATLRSKLVGFVFQSFHLLTSLTALENVMLPLELARVEKAKERAMEWLAEVGLARRANHYPRQLSGGEQQRVAIARAFATNPRLLFADEPTGNLDKQTGQRIIDLLFELNQINQTTLVLVTHDERLADRCQEKWVLQDGILQAMHTL